MAVDGDFLRIRYDRAVATSVKLREAWENEEHGTAAGSAAIQQALDDYNAAAVALTEAWNQRESGAEPA